MIPSVRSTGGGSQGDRWYPASFWALPKEIIFNLFNISAFASWIAFVGIDLLKEPFGSGSCSSCSSVADSETIL